MSYKDEYKFCFDEPKCCGTCSVKKEECEGIIGNVSKKIVIDKDTKVCEIKADLEVNIQRFVLV